MIHWEALAAAGLLAGLWVGGWRAHGGRLPRVRAAFFAAGLVALVVASVGPLHEAAERPLFAPHMLQHLLLTLVVPSCLLAGTMPFTVDAVLARALGRSALAWRLAGALTRPVPALLLHATALIAWHLPALYRLVVESHAWHLAQHASLFLTALLAWWPVLGPSRRLPPLPYAAQLLYLFAFGVPMTVVAAMVTTAEEVLYPTVAASPLADQRLGGVLMWVPAAVIPLVAFTVVFFRWVASEREEFA